MVYRTGPAAGEASLLPFDCMNKYLTYSLLSLTLLLAGAGAARAQAPADGGPAPTGPTAIPLDGGASLLLAGGIAYGLRRLKQRRQK